ncbi:MAG: helix-turn-helix domain-containing protein [Clostridiales bacterium]|jgi:transcriptional regulator with XRE-family HTH domain|nr:helix-turn-helix domain-containing protein [Clostridiales bacterium]
MEKNIFGERLRELREDYEISQSKLADILNISQRAISYWERGEKEPDIDMIRRLAKYFRTSTDYLLGMTSVKSEPDYKHRDKLPGEGKPRKVNAADFEDSAPAPRKKAAG